MKKLLLTLVLLASIVNAFAQQIAVFGTVQSATDNTALPAASVVLKDQTDATTAATLADVEGRFRFERVAPGQYTLEVNYLGFKKLSRAVQVQNSAVNLGVLALEEENTTLKEVQIVGRAPLGEQKGDTTQFNARAFKTNPDASAEDLVQKVPGVTIQNGTVQAQGEDVQQVLVDGKRYFGQDASTALRNLPAEMIDNIQIFDKRSDQAEFSGVDDGNREKTINIVTRKDRREGQIGKASAGYGTDDRYMVGASVNFFNDDRRITVTGLTNNINMFDFSVGETPGGDMRGRRGWGGGSPNGIINTNTLGLNYSDMWGEKMEVSGNYLFNSREIVNNQFRFQEYISPEDIGRTYDEDRYNTSTEDNHRLNMRLDYKINDRNRLLITPNITLQQRGNRSNVFGRTTNDNGPVNQTDNITNTENTDINFNNNIFYSHRFGKAGRTFSTRLNTSYSNTDGDTYFLSDDIYYRAATGDSAININRYTRLERENMGWSGNVTYNEPVGEHGRVQVEYNLGNQHNDSDNSTYNYAEQTASYSILNDTLSNIFRSDYFTQSAGIGYQYNTDKIRFQTNARYQHARLQSDQDFPREFILDRTFPSVLPSAELEYKFSKNKNLHFNYRTSTDAPSVSQLQNVVDYTNSLQLRSGNAALVQDYQNRLWMRYRAFNPETNRMFFMGLFGTFTQNYIGNSTFINRSDAAVVVDNGAVLGPGAQLTRPANLDGYWNARTFFSYGQPVNFISSNINVGGSVGYSRIPGLINDDINYANNTDLGVRLTLSSNISEKIDFTVSTNSSYNIIQNTLQTNRNNNYFSQNTSLRYNWIFWQGLVYRTELNHQLNSGLSEGYDNNYLLWNMSISKKVFKNQRGEVSLSVNDLLKQNLSIQRNVTDFYVEDVQSTVLQRYFMLTFTYNIRNYTGQLPDDMRDGGDRGGWRGGDRNRN